MVHASIRRSVPLLVGFMTLPRSRTKDLDRDAISCFFDQRTDEQTTSHATTNFKLNFDDCNLCARCRISSNFVSFMNALRTNQRTFPLMEMRGKIEVDSLKLLLKARLFILEQFVKVDYTLIITRASSTTTCSHTSLHDLLNFTTFFGR